MSACSMRTETRRRLSFGSFDEQVSQSHPIEGTPVDVPVPKKVSFIELTELTELTELIEFVRLKLLTKLSVNSAKQVNFFSADIVQEKSSFLTLHLAFRKFLQILFG